MTTVAGQDSDTQDSADDHTNQTVRQLRILSDDEIDDWIEQMRQEYPRTEGQGQYYFETLCRVLKEQMQQRRLEQQAG